jgi:rhamnosyltransferase
MSNNKIPRVSVIIRTKNCDNIVGQALEALFSQNYKDFELIVVDSGSTDNTLDIVSKYPCKLIHIPPNEYISGKALNLGVSNSRTELLVFQNSDTVPINPEALGLLIEALDDPNVHAAFARQMPRPDAWSWVQYELDSAFPYADESPPWITFEAPFSAMRRSAWEEHPFFEEQWGTEDTEWGYWARDNGKKIRYVKDSQVMHSHNHNLRQLYGRLFCDGEALALILKNKETILSSFFSGVNASIREIMYALKNGYFLDVFYIPIRRAVMHWAYYKGHKLGEHRLATGDKDPTKGQQVILKRYEG